MALFSALENMTMDADTDPMPDDSMLSDEDLFESCMELHEDHPHMMDCQNMCDTIDDLAHLHGVVEKFGVSKTMLAFANKGGILSSVMPAFAACEALTGDAAADSAEAKAAMESTLEKVKEVAGAWFHKAWSIVSGWGAKIGAFCKAGYDKAVMATKWAAGKTIDAAKAAKESITAHPVAWVIGAAATAAAVAGVFYTLWNGDFPWNEEAFKHWESNTKNSISSAFRSKNGAPAEAVPEPEPGKSVMDHVDHAVGAVQGAGLHAMSGMKAGTAAALGYTKEGFDHMVNAVKGLYADGGALHKLSEFFKTGAEKAFEHAKEHGKEGVAWVRKAISFLMKETMHLWSRAPATTLKYFTKALSVFKHLFDKAPAAVAA